MGRRPTDNPKRGEYITRTLEVHNYLVRYAVPGAKEVSETRIRIAAGGRKQADKLVRKRARDFGTVIDCEHISEEKQLWGQKLEDFFKNATRLKEFENMEENVNG